MKNGNRNENKEDENGHSGGSLMDRTLERWKNKRVAVGVGSDASFTGLLLEFDGEFILLKDVVDFVGNRTKELLVKIDDVNWMTLLR